MLEYRQADFAEALLLDLLFHGVPVDTWGQGEANTLEKLVKEISERECKLVFEDGKVIWTGRVVNLDVFYKDENGVVYKLKEDKQVYHDGTQDGRIRNRKLPCSLIEKVKLNENVHDGTLRALKEELQLEGEFNIGEADARIFFVPSKSYPGLMTESVNYIIPVYLSSEQFNPDGYKEEQPDKTTYFVWEKV